MKNRNGNQKAKRVVQVLLVFALGCAVAFPSPSGAFRLAGGNVTALDFTVLPGLDPEVTKFAFRHGNRCPMNSYCWWLK